MTEFGKHVEHLDAEVRQAIATLEAVLADADPAERERTVGEALEYLSEQRFDELERLRHCA